MNESDYMRAIWSRTSKIKDGQKYLDTGWFDAAFGGADARRNLMLNRMGAENQVAQRRLSVRGREMDRSADLARDIQRSSSKDALTADIIGAASLPLAYYQGRKEASAVKSDTDRINRTTNKWRAMLP